METNGAKKKNFFFAVPSRLPSPLVVYLLQEKQVRAAPAFTPPQTPGEKRTTRGQRAALPPFSRSNLSACPSGIACKALTHVTELEESPGEDESSLVGAATPRGRGSPGLSHRRRAESCADSDSEVRARARAGRGAARTRPRRAALSARHQIGNKTLTGLSACCSVPWTCAPARNGVRAVNSLAPPLPCPDPGRGSHLPLGPASRCRRTSGARPPRALPGVKEKPYRRSARAHSPPALRRTAGGEAGAGAERRGTRGRNQPNSRAWLRRRRGMQAGEQPAGAALPAEWGRRCPRPRASTIVWALGSPLAPPPRLSAPHPTRLPPREKAEGAAGAGSERGVAERPGTRVRGGRRGKGRCVPSGGGDR